MMVLAFILAGLVFTHLVQPWHILVLAFLLGVANSFDAPARQAFVSEMVAREDLTNAIALNSTLFNSATAVGPAVAGVTYALFGPGWCFMLNGLSFIAVIVALRMMNLAPVVRRPRTTSAVAELKEGIHYVITHPIVRVLIAIIAMNSMFGLSFATLIPAWAVNVLGGDATTNGLLYSARGVGSLMGALMIASLGHQQLKGKFLMRGALTAPLFFFAFALLRWLPLSLLALVGAGFGVVFVGNLANAMVQTSTPDHLRGRVMGAFTWIFFGFMPLGALWTGVIAGRYGEPEAVVINAFCALAFTLLVWILFPRIRQQ